MLVQLAFYERQSKRRPINRHIQVAQDKRQRPDVIFAGQLTGVEGYMESSASGIMAGINMDRLLRNAEPVVPPPTTMIGGLFRYLREAPPAQFQPMNSNFGLLDSLAEHVRDKGARREQVVARAQVEMEKFVVKMMSL